MTLARTHRALLRLQLSGRGETVWRFEYQTISDIRVALARARAEAEADLTARRFSSFQSRGGPLLYVVYLRDFPAGPFPLTAPYGWERVDLGSLRVVLEAAFSTPAAQTVYAHYLLSARDPSGSVLSPAGRVDLLLGRRIATALPEDHPARHRPPNLKTVNPVLFYEDDEES